MTDVLTRRYPDARWDSVVESIHGVEIADPFRWLEDQQSAETRAWIAEQNGYTKELLGNRSERDVIQRRLSQLMKIDTFTIPTARNGQYFYMRRMADQDLYVLTKREGLYGADESIIDPYSLSSDGSVNVQLWDVSRSGRLLIYGIRRGGEDETEVKIFDVERQQDLPDSLPRGRYFGVSLEPDGSGFYYSRYEDSGGRIYYHKIDSSVSEDMVIFGEGYGPEMIIDAELSEDGSLLLITVEHGAAAQRCEIYYQDAGRGGPILPIVNDVDARFSALAVDGRVFLNTNWKAPNGRILSVDLNIPERSHWREIIPESEAVIEEFSVAGGRMFISSLQNVSSRLAEYDLEGVFQREISLPAIGSASCVSGEWSSSEAFFSFTSFHVPTVIYRYDVGTGEKQTWSELEAPLNSSQIEVRQVWYPSKDGARIPMFLVHRRGLRHNGQTPVYLTGYGGFNANMTPSFSPRAALWSESGGLFAMPSLRGGGEFGEQWHRSGMLESKQNVFDDFISAAEWLIKENYTNPSRLAIAGGSNGGLLVGAALTQRPELFRAVVCSYPLLDMVRYHRFLVAQFWVPEYGSSEDFDQFQYLYAYSPYHRVRPGVRYPAVLFITGDADTRVDPLHARKMTALLQLSSTSGNPILLHYDTTAGHSGGRPLSQEIEDRTDELTFLFWQLGIEAHESLPMVNG